MTTTEHHYIRPSVNFIGLLGQKKTTFRHQLVSIVVANPFRRLRFRVMHITKKPRTGRARHHTGGFAFTLRQGLVVNAINAQGAFSSSPSNVHRIHGHRTGTPKSNTYSQCTCRNRPTQFRHSPACGWPLSGTPARKVDLRNVNTISENESSRYWETFQPRRFARG